MLDGGNECLTLGNEGAARSIAHVLRKGGNLHAKVGTHENDAGILGRRLQGHMRINAGMKALAFEEIFLF